MSKEELDRARKLLEDAQGAPNDNKQVLALSITEYLRRYAGEASEFYKFASVVNGSPALRPEHHRCVVALESFIDYRARGFEV